MQIRRLPACMCEKGDCDSVMHDVRRMLHSDRDKDTYGSGNVYDSCRWSGRCWSARYRHRDTILY